MRRVFEVLAGIALTVLAGVLLAQPWINNFEKDFDSRLLVGSLLCGFIGMPCIVCWKRPITTRLWLGYLCVLMVCIVVDVARADELNWQTAMLAVIVGIPSGGYALTGYYPGSFPMAHVFCKNQRPENSEAKNKFNLGQYRA